MRSATGTPMIRRLRIGTGLVLFTFVTCHLINHALGLVSLDALERGRLVLTEPWGNWVASTLLYGALTVHLGLAVWAVYERRTWRLSPMDWLQLLSGLIIPIYLVPHVLNTNLAGELYAFDPTYRFELLLFFVIAPGLSINQTVLILLSWGHGVIGVYQWLRLKPWFAHVRAYAFAFALLLPTLSLAGVWVAGTGCRRACSGRSLGEAGDRRGELDERGGNRRADPDPEGIHLDARSRVRYRPGVALGQLKPRPKGTGRAHWLSRRAQYYGHAGHDDPRGEPAERRSSCRRVRGQGPLFDMSGAYR